MSGEDDGKLYVPLVGFDRGLATRCNHSLFALLHSFVGGLAWATTNESLKEAFEKHGEIVKAEVVYSRDTGAWLDP